MLKRFFGRDATIVRTTDFRLILLATIFAPLGTGIISPILDSLKGVYGVPESSVGLMVSALYVPAIFVIPVIGILSDRIGRKPVLVFSIVLFGLTGSAISLTTNFYSALALRFLQGVGFAGLSPTLITIIGDLYEGSKEETAQGLRLTAGGISNIGFPILAGSLVVFSWKYPFFLYLLAVPAGVAIYLWLEESKLRTSQMPSFQSPRRGSQIKDLSRLIMHRRIGGIIMGRTLISVVWVVFLSYNSIVVVTLASGTAQQAGLLVAIGSLTFASTASQVGRITVYYDSRFYPLIAAHCMMGVGFSLFGFADSFSSILVGVIFGGAGFGISAAMYRSIITSMAPTHLRGGLVSLGESSSRIGSAVAPVLVGISINVLTPDFGTTLAIQWSIVGISIISGILGIFFLIVVRTGPPIEMLDAT